MLMRPLSHLLMLLMGLCLAAQASVTKTPTEELAQPQAQSCPSLRGRYSCRAPFMLSFKRKRKHEMKVVQSERDGFSIFLFEASDGADGFWAVGDGTPHAYESEAAQAWGFKEIDTEASCPKPESLEIRFMVLPGKKTRLSSTLTPKGKPSAPARTSGILTFTDKGRGLVQITARAFAPGGHRPLVETTTCQRVAEVDY